MLEKINKDILSKVVIIGIAIFGGIAIYLSTHHGPGIGGDATIYLFSAKNFLAGHGLGLIEPDGSFRLIPYFPPFYSLVLSFFGLLNFDLITTARWINIILFSGLILLIGLVMWKYSRSIFFTAATCALIAFSPLLIPAYSWAMSEPLAIFLGFLGLLLLFCNKNNKFTLIVFLSALFVGLSILTRYSHIAFLITAVVFIIFKRKIFANTIKNLVAYGLTSTIPISIWIIYDLLNTTTISSRSLETLSGAIERASNFWPLFKDVVLFWLIPDSWINTPKYPLELNTGLFYISILCIILGIGIVYIKRNRKPKELYFQQLFDLAILLIVFVISYTGIIFFVYLTTYPPITIGSRMFSTVHIAIFWLIMVLLVLIQKIWDKSIALKICFIFGTGIFVLWYGWRSELIVKQYYKLGLGYTSVSWQESDTIAAIKDLPEDQLIVSNEQNAVLFLTDRIVYPFKEIYYDTPLDNYFVYGDGDLENDVGQIKFKEDGAALVLFDSIYFQMNELYGDNTDQRIDALIHGLDKAFRGADGTIYYYPENKRQK